MKLTEGSAAESHLLGGLAFVQELRTPDLASILSRLGMVTVTRIDRLARGQPSTSSPSSRRSSTRKPGSAPWPSRGGYVHLHRPSHDRGALYGGLKLDQAKRLKTWDSLAPQTANDFGNATAISRVTTASTRAGIPERSDAPIGRARSRTMRASSPALFSGTSRSRA
jgi:hypothetical protein